MTDPTSNRRPLASRNTALAARATRILAARGVTPNAISQASIVMALLAGACLWAGGQAEGGGAVLLLLLGAVFCQLRLVCNLLDGMVAVEAGRGAADGPFWNEFPDRLADLAILAGLGMGAGLPSLGWAAGALAVLTAYVREMGVALGRAPDFGGPMAKPHRMALVTLGAAAAALEPLVWPQERVLAWTLWLLVAGTALTVLLRAMRLRAYLLAR